MLVNSEYAVSVDVDIQPLALQTAACAVRVGIVPTASALPPNIASATSAPQRLLTAFICSYPFCAPGRDGSPTYLISVSIRDRVPSMCRWDTFG